jgi:acyl-CoA reductase-like NAD-dependent aldehyde dehydrogenase
MATQFKLLINGALVDGDSTMDVLNPATEEVVMVCPRGSEAQLNAAVAAAKAAFPAWSKTPIAERQTILVKIAEAVESHGDELARIVTQEQGKPLADAQGEVAGAAAFFRYFSTQELHSEVMQDDAGKKIEAHRRPLGVIGAITPWNFPLILMAFKVGPALVTGNTVVLKPAPTTPLSAVRFGELIKDIVPAGVVNIVTDANDLGGVLSKHPDVRKVSFTGSTATGKKVMESAASALKRITLELGGNDAAIVLEDVDPKATAQKVFAGAFQNNGQVCIAVKRVYAHEKIYDALCDELAVLADAAVIGDGLEQGTQIGPLQNKMQYAKVKEYLEDGRKNGKIIAGGVVPDKAGYFIRPTIVRDITDGTRLVDEEQFGPVLPVIKFADAEDALARANNTTYGLGGSMWAKDLDKAYKLAERMESGTVWINQHADINPNVPFGGAKQSGFGAELGEEGLAEFTQLQIINVNRAAI